MSAVVDTVLSAEGVEFSYGRTPALRGATLHVAAGESVALMGPSGSGKSTLLLTLAGVLEPDAGHTALLGAELSGRPAAERAQRRLCDVGLVLQSGGLTPELTLAENAALPLELTGTPRSQARAAALVALAAFGVADEAERRADEVSGGQAQRGAIARALVRRPPVVLADEPTGALDSVTGDAVMRRLVEWTREAGAALLVVTHDHRVAAYLDRHVVLRDGAVEAPVGARP